MLQIAALTALCSFAAAPAATTHDTNLRDTLLAQEVRLLEAIQHQDDATQREILSDQTLSVSREFGRLDTPQLLDMLRNMKVTSYDFADAKAFRISDDTAILTYRFTWSGTEQGESVEPRYDTATHRRIH